MMWVFSIAVCYIYLSLYTLAYELKTGALYPAVFPNKGPDVDIRSASHFKEGCEVFQLYMYSRGVSLCCCV